MSRLQWDAIGERYFETGVSNGVLYPTTNTGAYGHGVAWNGLTGVTESPSGAESNKQYADNQVYLNLISAEELSGTIEAFQSPVEFDQCDGSTSPLPGVSFGQQRRRAFGLSYQTLLGNDTEGQDHAYKLHLIYGAMAAPSERAYATVNDSPEAITLSWEFNCTPVSIPDSSEYAEFGLRPTASIAIDSRMYTAQQMDQIKNILWGSSGSAPRLPMPEELLQIIGADTLVEVTPTAPTFDDTEGVVTLDFTNTAWEANGAAVANPNDDDSVDVMIEDSTLFSAVAKAGTRLAAGQRHWVFTP